MVYYKQAPARRYMAQKPLQKRWYIDAAIPKSVPFIGGSSFKAGSGALTKRSLTAIMRESGENKQKIVANGSTANVLSNTIYTFNPFGNIPIQAGVNGRIGAGIYVKDWIFKMTMSNAGADFPDATGLWRVMVVSTDAAYLSGDDTLSSGVGSTEVFVQGSSDLINANVDKNRCTVLHDSLHELQTLTASARTSRQLVVNCCKGKTLRYLSPTSNYINGKNVYLLLIPQTQGYGSTIKIGTVKFESLVDFTDI